MITEIYTKKGEFLIEFNKFNGSGWSNELIAIIENKINPDTINKRIIEESWEYSEIEFDIEKDNVKFILHLDDEGSRYLILIDDDSDKSKQKLRDWALIIAKEVDRIKR